MRWAQCCAEPAASAGADSHGKCLRYTGMGASLLSLSDPRAPAVLRNPIANAFRAMGLLQGQVDAQMQDDVCWQDIRNPAQEKFHFLLAAMHDLQDELRGEYVRRTQELLAENYRLRQSQRLDRNVVSVGASHPGDHDRAAFLQDGQAPEEQEHIDELSCGTSFSPVVPTNPCVNTEIVKNVGLSAEIGAGAMDTLCSPRQCPRHQREAAHWAVEGGVPSRHENTALGFGCSGMASMSFCIPHSQSALAIDEEMAQVERVSSRVRSRLFPDQCYLEDCFVTTDHLKECMFDFGWTDFGEEQAAWILRGLKNANRSLKRKSNNKTLNFWESTTRASGSVFGHRRQSSLVPGSPCILTWSDFHDTLFHNDLRKYVGGELWGKTMAMKEVLTSGAINKLISDIARIPVSDMAAVPPRTSLLETLEPVVAGLIVINGALLAVQSDEKLEQWPGWIYVELFFVALFTAEICWRMSDLGPRYYFRGPGWCWNWVDFVIVVCSLVENALQINWSANVLRVCRLTRLSRLLRMLRFRLCQDLTLMLRGLLGGFRTLGWAMILLLAMIFVIALFICSTLGNNDRMTVLFEAEANLYFSTVPRCMFLVFRCFLGECTDSTGVSLVTQLSNELGFQFVLPYVLTAMLIQFGIFNLIIAVYIEATMDASKQEVSPECREQQRYLATHAKVLAKRIVSLVRFFRGNGYGQLRHGTLHECEDVTEEFSVDKTAFQFILNDQVVEATLDSLDVPFNRTHLFDVLDSDGSGQLTLKEMVNGIIQSRGEARNRDTVACLLSIRSLQAGLSSCHSDVRRLACFEQENTNTKAAGKMSESMSDGVNRKSIPGTISPRTQDTPENQEDQFMNLEDQLMLLDDHLLMQEAAKKVCARGRQAPMAKIPDTPVEIAPSDDDRTCAMGPKAASPNAPDEPTQAPPSLASTGSTGFGSGRSSANGRSVVNSEGLLSL